MSARKNLSMSCGAFLVVFALSFATAQTDLEDTNQIDLESMEEIQELLRNVQLIFETKVASKVRQGMTPEEDAEGGAMDPNGCRCSGMTCSCCQRIRMKIFKVNDDCCLSVTYLPRNYGILIRMAFGRKQLFSKEISAKNPPPICVGVPAWRKGASVCIQLFNLNVNKKTFSGCARFRATLLYVTILKINLGCFRINFLDETQRVDAAVELPYFAVPQALLEGPDPIYLGEVQMEKIQPADHKKNQA